MKRCTLGDFFLNYTLGDSLHCTRCKGTPDIFELAHSGSAAMILVACNTDYMLEKSKIKARMMLPRARRAGSRNGACRLGPRTLSYAFCGEVASCEFTARRKLARPHFTPSCLFEELIITINN